MLSFASKARLASLAAVAVAASLLLLACQPQPRPRTPEAVRAELVRLLPPKTADRKGWAADIQLAMAAMEIDPSTQNLCSVLAVTEQESTFTADPVVPGLGKIALAEIDRRAQRRKVPLFIVHAALRYTTHDGKSYADRIAAVRTERELSSAFEDFISSFPLGKRLLQGANPVRTGGPMQVSIDFAEQHARRQPYPYPVATSIRHEVFTRRGGMYFGIAHLLGYRASYQEPLYRFADFNAGFYASRNAAFQNAVGRASGTKLTLDGDLVDPGAKGNKVGATEAAVRSLARQLEMTDAQIHRALLKGSRSSFERTELYARVFELAEQLEHQSLPRAVMPRIRLESPKITRKLTTEWFATRVNQRYRRCMAKAAAQ